MPSADGGRSRSPSPLLDRVEERSAIDRIIEAIDSGLSGVCVLAGDAGMGKTRLLEYAVESAPRLQRLWISGVEAERELGYAALDRLLRPFFVRSDSLPEPQRRALESAVGLRPGGPADRFLVGLATLNLLAAAADDRGLICVVDDAQWLDPESLDALTFAARRLGAERIALLFGVRDIDTVAGAFVALPVVDVVGLAEDASLELLLAHTPTPMDPDVARRVIVSTAGCPLALIELATGLTRRQWLGGLLDGDALPIGQQLEDHFQRQVHQLEPDAQMFLLVAAVESSGDPALVRRAALLLGADSAAEDAATASGLVALRPHVVFRHPLVRAAVYAASPRSVRSQVHETIAAVIDRTDPDRRVRHLAAAAREPDEALAVQLEEAADRSRSRGGHAAETSFLVSAAYLSPSSGARARRLLRAATAALYAGLPQRAEALLDQARPGLEDPLLVIDAMRLDGRLRLPLVDAASAPARLLAAARELEAVEPKLVRAALLEALEACAVSQRFTRGVTPQDVARATLATRDLSPDPPTLSDLFLDGTALSVMSEFAPAAAIFRRAAEVMRGGAVDDDDLVHWFHLGFIAASELLDDAAYNAWVSRVERHARDVGALVMCQVACLGRAKQEVREGRFAAAELTVDEVVDLTRSIGGPTEFYELAKAEVYAWRGQEAETRATAKRCRQLGAAVGAAPAVNMADLSLATLELSLGRYAEALAAIEPLVEEHQVGFTCGGLATAVEAASRSDEPGRAAGYLADLRQRAAASGTNWALGQLARCCALLADDTKAEGLHLEAIGRLELTSVVTELAQARLAYGEWLRRRQRRKDARMVLRVAHDSFAVMGAEGFAARARAELAATGEKISRRVAGPVMDLTPQEAQVARLAATGGTNAEIAARMFISANTVDYHLRKVYRKFGIGSRREIASAIAPLDLQ